MRRRPRTVCATYKLKSNHCNGFHGESTLAFDKQNFKRRSKQFHDERSVLLVHAVIVNTRNAFCNPTVSHCKRYLYSPGSTYWLLRNVKSFGFQNYAIVALPNKFYRLYDTIRKYLMCDQNLTDSPALYNVRRTHDIKTNKKLSYRRDSARCVKRPFKVIRCGSKRRGI